MQNTLNKSDIKEWGQQTLIYSVLIPVALVFLTSLQSGVDFKMALTAGLYALISALINLLTKYSAGVKTDFTKYTGAPSETGAKTSYDAPIDVPNRVTSGSTEL